LADEVFQFSDTQAMTKPPTYALLYLERPDLWPPDLRDYLNQHYDLFLDWADGPTKYSAPQYDRAIYGLRDCLGQYAITGWHCTRLTLDEMAIIKGKGMQLPNRAMLVRRIDALVEGGQLSVEVAHRLKAKNQANESNRAGMVWFCFFPPRVAGESGVARFFQCWGGEALYNSHERDPNMAPILGRIGVPSLVEADVPISSLEPNGGLSFKIVRRFLISRGHETSEPVDHEDRIKRPLPAPNVRRIIVHPEPDFLELTGCDEWRRPISG